MIILDDFEKENLLDIISYKQGIDLVRNFILLDDNKTIQGFNRWEFEPTLTFTMYIHYQNTRYTVGAHNTAEEFVEEIRTNSTVRALGINAEEAPLFASGLTNSSCLRVFTDGDNDYRDFVIQVTPGIGSGGWDFEYYGTTYYFTLMAYGDSQTIQAVDTNSVLKYGANIYTAQNLDLITSPSEKQTVLDNKLAELKDPKARMEVAIPFDYEQPREFLEVQVRLSYRDTGQFQSFKEGGHFKTWADAGDYRYKNFYIVAIRNQQDGKRTRIKLLEKEDA